MNGGFNFSVTKWKYVILVLLRSVYESELVAVDGSQLSEVCIVGGCFLHFSVTKENTNWKVFVSFAERQGDTRGSLSHFLSVCLSIAFSSQ